MTKIFLKKNEDRRIRQGHLWIFSNEINEIDGEVQSGDLVELNDNQKNYLGQGFYNKNSLIALRLLSRNKESDLRKIFLQKILQANELRKQFYLNRNSYRMVFGESDFLPGLIIDKFNETFVLQVHSVGMEKNIELIIQILKEELKAKNIFTKNEEYFRKLEGLPEDDQIYFGNKSIEIVDDGLIKYKIDFEKSQKTGFYFDQSDNRFFIQRLCNGKKILDAFCNSGGFGLHAANAGASEITFVDSSSTEIESAKTNFELNNFTAQSEFIVSDVFDYLQKCIAANKQFDVAIIDPPAFAKNKKSLPTARKGYEKLNRLAIQSVNNNGFLVSSSCSYHLTKDEFLQIINTAAVKAGRTIQLVYFNNASLDHPQNPAMEETVYLKFAVFRVLE
ncbi:MAG: class I SAM-dependent rRNA methyltransferase [Ignavibacteriales bacterium]|nr:class I SAM-dependent rRNA methyltransferase [Ignavibacteriales bacterium]